MTERKDKQKISNIIFGKAGEVFTNIRLFLWSKKIEKISEAEQAKIEDVRAKLAELFGGPPASIREAFRAGEIGEAKADGKNDDIDFEEPAEALAAVADISKKEEVAELAKKDLPAIITGPVPSQLQTEEPEKEMVFIKLSEIAKNSTYSKNYINYSARQGKLKANTNVMEILLTLVLFMSGFAQKKKIQSMLMVNQALNGEAAIRAIFNGLNSFKK